MPAQELSEEVSIDVELVEQGRVGAVVSLAAGIVLDDRSLILIVLKAEELTCARMIVSIVEVRTRASWAILVVPGGDALVDDGQLGPGVSNTAVNNLVAIGEREVLLKKQRAIHRMLNGVIPRETKCASLIDEILSGAVEVCVLVIVVDDAGVLG